MYTVRDPRVGGCHGDVNLGGGVHGKKSQKVYLLEVASLMTVDGRFFPQ